MVIITAAFEHAVNIVLNHAPWVWPHQGSSSQEMVNVNGSTHTHQSLSSAGGRGAGTRPRCPRTDARPWV